MPQVVQHEWGRDLISSWNKHDWWQAQQRVGRKISRIIGAAADEVLVADSTSINLFKVVAAALDLHPGKIIVSGAQVFHVCPCEDCTFGGRHLHFWVH